jgi:hypothetical protein
MIFVIEYNRSVGAIVSMQSFDSAERDAAELARHGLELRAAADANLEIVTLQAASEDALRKTHRRYFTNDFEALVSAA